MWKAMLFHAWWYQLLACLLILFLPLFFKALGIISMATCQQVAASISTDSNGRVYVCAGGRELSVDLYAVLCNRQAGLWRISFHAVSMSAHLAKCVWPCTAKNPHSRLRREVVAGVPHYRFMQLPGISEILCVRPAPSFLSHFHLEVACTVCKNTLLRAYFRK